jgi:hypothetical protein
LRGKSPLLASLPMAFRYVEAFNPAARSITFDVLQQSDQLDREESLRRRRGEGYLVYFDEPVSADVNHLLRVIDSVPPEKKFSIPVPEFHSVIDMVVNEGARFYRRQMQRTFPEFKLLCERIFPAESFDEYPPLIAEGIDQFPRNNEHLLVDFSREAARKTMMDLMFDAGLLLRDRDVRKA